MVQKLSELNQKYEDIWKPINGLRQGQTFENLDYAVKEQIRAYLVIHFEDNMEQFINSGLTFELLSSIQRDLELPLEVLDLYPQKKGFHKRLLDVAGYFFGHQKSA